ncbi:MAG: pyruvate dehydrogenase [Anaerolineae bacterium]|nr:MAG: pyruvate dehydrogenase [Anaerolineae bacterium]
MFQDSYEQALYHSRFDIIAPMTDNLQLYRTMLLIRRFEERALSEFSTGKLFGTTHAYIGQEANAAAIFSLTQPDDIVWSNHRCHGHFLAYGGDPYQLAAELMGRATGLVGGRGGSQHIHWRNFYSNGIQGGFAPIAAGMALAEKAHPTGKIVLAFLGDGTLGEGALYESLNLAALWQLPVLYVLENNRIAQTTPVELAVAGSMAARFQAFGIPVWEVDSSDVLVLHPMAQQAIQHVRTGQPAALILHTYRFAAHSKGDDTRPREEIARLRAERDPLVIHAARLTQTQCEQIETEIGVLIEQAFTRAEKDVFPVFSHSVDPSYTPLSTQRVFAPLAQTAGDEKTQVLHPPRTVLESLNLALHTALETDSRVYVLGEDILDPYGGAFKVTRGLSTRFPQRVLTTPISEAAILGCATGMALHGLRPVAEVMFGDFVTLMADQLINHAAKFRWMYNEQVRVPLVLRAPMGGRRGYGPTHSQSLEKHFLGVPGLKVVAPNALGDPGALLLAAIADDDPVLFVEHKLLYTRPLLTGQDLVEWKTQAVGEPFPDYLLQNVDDFPAQMTIATYGYNLELVLAAAHALMYEYEIFPEIILFSRLSPFPCASVLFNNAPHPLFQSVAKTRRLLTVEEGTLTLGWGAEIGARSMEQVSGLKLRRVAALDLPIANSKSLEDVILPSTQSILQAALDLVHQKSPS